MLAFYRLVVWCGLALSVVLGSPAAWASGHGRAENATPGAVGLTPVYRAAEGGPDGARSGVAAGWREVARRQEAPGTSDGTGRPGPVSRLARGFEAPDGNGGTVRPFDASWFAYTVGDVEVVWATPTDVQTLALGRPPTWEQLPEGVGAGEISWPTPRRMWGAELRWLAFRASEAGASGAAGAWVPALLATPEDQPGPFPLVVAAHGLLSQKMQVISQVGPALVARGFAVLAIDLPRHGEREGSGLDFLDRRNPRAMFELWREAVTDLRRALDVARELAVVDQNTPVTLLGYSLGSWLSAIAGAADERVGQLVLMVGGATELEDRLLELPFIATSDPRSAVAAFSPRPLLMVNALRDRTVTPEMARRLFEAAGEPKLIRWYDMGHILREPAYAETAEWLMAELARHSPAPSGR